MIRQSKDKLSTMNVKPQRWEYYFTTIILGLLFTIKRYSGLVQGYRLSDYIVQISEHLYSYILAVIILVLLLSFTLLLGGRLIKKRGKFLDISIIVSFSTYPLILGLIITIIIKVLSFLIWDNFMFSSGIYRTLENLILLTSLLLSYRLLILEYKIAIKTTLIASIIIAVFGSVLSGIIGNYLIRLL